MLNSTIRIEGHTDTKGSRNYNQRLLEKRAIFIKNYFIQHGIKANRLITKGYGFDRLYDIRTSRR